MKMFKLCCISALSMVALLASCGNDTTSEEQGTKEKQVSNLKSRITESSDSLALVDFYNALDGGHWYKNEGWLEKPLKDWYGVKVANGRVVSLCLVHNNLKGKLPESIGKLSRLQRFNLSYNTDLGGSIPDEVYNLTELKSLKLSFTSLTGSLSDRIGCLTSLDSLDMWTSPWDMKHVTHAQNPDVLTGAIPQTINNLKKLSFLRLGRQGFTSMPEVIDLPNLVECDLAVCNLKGRLPQFKNAEKLKVLYLSKNKFEGGIPDSYGHLKVKELYLSNNNLTGSIPESFAHLSAVQQLSLENNRLSGSIDVLTKLPNVYCIYLAKNDFTGVFSPLFGVKQPHLMVVDCAGTKIMGQTKYMNSSISKVKK